MKSPLLLALVILSSIGASAADAVIRGTIIDSGSPVNGATVVVQRLTDEACVKLFQSKKTSVKNVRKLEACTTDFPQLSTGNAGEFSTTVPAGWYDVRVLWLMRSKPAYPPITCKYHEWVITVSPVTDRTRKYDTFAQSPPFQVHDRETRTIDLTYDAPLASKGPCLSGGVPR